MNIAIQATLPLTVALTSTHAGADSDRLEALSAQRMPLPELNSNGVTRETLDNQDEEQARKAASLASGTANFLTSDVNKADAASSMARGMAASEASGQAQAWLSRFGTARVQIDVDDKLSLASSSLDLLLPVRDEQKHLLFTQGSIHRTDDRNQANLGVGVRRFNDGYMLGANTFFDHDLSRSHSRLGVGVEYWRDYLKLSANGYHRLSSWRTSPDLDDYQERPANGWDVRAEGWLPSMPQLGGKLTYEKYYGSEVGLFGKDNRKKNPHAITTGVTYTPIPLLTFSAEQRRGNAGASDTQFGMQFNWSLGQSWSKQTDPSKVAAMRTLAGSRYDLVERNNNIVLEYRKKEVIRLNVARQLAGASGERKSLQVTVQSKYGLERIDWSAATLLQAGGKIEHLGGSDYQLTLPQYRTGAQAVNTYTLHGVAVDKQGNRSNRSETQVTVNAPVFDAARSTFLPADTILPTNSTQVLTLTVRDAQDGLIDVPLSDLSLAVTRGTASTGTKVSDFSRKSVGMYEVTVTAGTLPEALTLTPSYQSTPLAAAKISVKVRVPEAGNSTFAASPKTIDTSGTVPVTLELKANDADGNPVPDLAGQLAFVVQDAGGNPPGTGITISQVTETQPGAYTARLTGTKAGVWTILPHYQGAVLGTLKDTVTLTTGPIAAKRSRLVAAPDSIDADGSKTSTLTLTAKDAEDNPVTNLADKLSFNAKDSSGGDAGVTITVVTETKPGIYEAKLSGTKADSWTVSPVLDSITLGIEGKVDLTPGALDAGSSDFIANPTAIVAGSGEESELKLTAKDAHGNLVPGIAGDLEFEVTDSKGVVALTTKIQRETTPGIYTTKLSGTWVGTWSVTPLYKKTRLVSLTKQIYITSAAPAPGNSTFTVSDTTGHLHYSTIQLQFEARDEHNQRMPELENALEFVVKSDSKGRPLVKKDVLIGPVRERRYGIYTATFRSNLVDVHTIVPTFNGADIGTLSQTVTISLLDERDVRVFSTTGGRLNVIRPFRAPLFKGAEIYFDVFDAKDDYEVTLESGATWLSKTNFNSTSFKVTSPPNANTAKIKLIRKRGTEEQTYEFTPKYYMPINDKLTFTQAVNSCKDKGLELANGVIAKSHKDRIPGLWLYDNDSSKFKNTDFKPDWYWVIGPKSLGGGPLLYHAGSGEDKTADITEKSYYICMNNYGQTD
ncbi:inverse autotransporter beta domain-containing protein [Pseudomonas guariconensis]|uniref:inverse autotransporter beta domain-containing protein n=1 Tax=Pseudomonas guariconensis TaxID=1288410 RepID=UPI003F92AB8A